MKLFRSLNGYVRTMMSAPQNRNRMASARSGGTRRVAQTAANDKAVRVCFVIDNLARAGTESQLLLLLKRLDRSKVAPYLCLLEGRDETSRNLEPADVPILRLGVRHLLSCMSSRQAYRFWRFLRTRAHRTLSKHTSPIALASPPQLPRPPAYGSCLARGVTSVTG